MGPTVIMPLTPASSTEIKGQDHSRNLDALQFICELPPPAMMTSTETINPSSLIQLTPCETVKLRRRSMAPKQGRRPLPTLPPPPTRTRKIIQMKPAEEVRTDMSPISSKDASNGATPSDGNPTPYKKRRAATSPSAKLAARRVAHSDIERRRRSKINEEFEKLKSLVPACAGEDMHKLAILQAATEYVQYLQDCVGRLESSREYRLTPLTPASRRPSTFVLDDTSYVDEEDSPGPATIDTHVDDDTRVSLAVVQDSGQEKPPAAWPESVALKAATDDRRHRFRFSASTTPALGPQPDARPAGFGTSSGSALASPILEPEQDGLEQGLGEQEKRDQERQDQVKASAALLMLNADRRGIKRSRGGGGRPGTISVQDLLNTL
ncbi:hypothetical protein F4780DRAFT_767796 [Xylariomycetidae sp. FL0641]|nr:hypothetical protein F4780DRAFT_767796 [Xylariomycetidae sp. FL0641]